MRKNQRNTLNANVEWCASLYQPCQCHTSLEQKPAEMNERPKFFFRIMELVSVMAKNEDKMHQVLSGTLENRQQTARQTLSE